MVFTVWKLHLDQIIHALEVREICITFFGNDGDSFLVEIVLIDSIT